MGRLHSGRVKQYRRKQLLPQPRGKCNGPSYDLPKTESQKVTESQAGLKTKNSKTERNYGKVAALLE